MSHTLFFCCFDVSNPLSGVFDEDSLIFLYGEKEEFE